MSAAPSWPLIASPGGANLPKQRLPPPSGLNFDPFRRPKAQNTERKRPRSVPQTTKTQNDARGARTHPLVRTITSRTAKARNCLSPDGSRTETPLRRPTGFSCCQPNMGRRYPRFEGEAPRSPHFFVFDPQQAVLLHAFCSNRGHKARYSCKISRSDGDRAMLPPGHQSCWKPRAAVGRRNSRAIARLLELDLGASLLELSLDLFSLVLVDAFLDRLRSTLDQVLGFLQA